MDNKVSIVIPVYNIEKYLGECVESLLRQTYQNLEIILVDDESKDSSPEICDRYAAQDSRIRVIHKPNGGAASARNAGIDIATGDYLCFVDGDDFVSENYVQHLLTNATNAGADICVCTLTYITKSGTQPVNIEPTGVYSRNEYLLAFLKHWTCALMTNKIFLRSAIGSIRFEEGHKIDDEFFTYLVVMNTQKVVVTDTPLYFYRMRGSSVMQAMAPHLEQIMLDRIEYLTTRYSNISRHILQLEEPFLLDALNTICRYWHHSKNMPKAQAQIRSWVKQHRCRIMKLNIPLRSRLAYLYRLYIKKPAIMSEPKPIQMNSEDYFD